MAMAEIEPRAVIKSMKSTFTSVVGFGMCWRTQRNHLTEASERVGIGMTDKVDKAMFCALETCILIIGGVLTGCMSVILMAFVMEIPMPGKVLSFCSVEMIYGFVCAFRWMGSK